LIHVKLSRLAVNMMDPVGFLQNEAPSLRTAKGNAMIMKSLIAISMLLGITAASGLAYAGPQPSDPHWWPNHNRSNATSQPPQVTTDGWQKSPASASIKPKAAKPRTAKPSDHRFYGPRGFH
jgi:hypothetical protein